MLDELILHIGTHKTGTTSIQNACAAHAKDLAKSGITYPRRHLNETGHHEIYWGLRQSPQRHKTISLFDIAHSYITEAKQDRTNRLLISNEALWSLTASEIKTLVELFPAKKYKVILYLRRQDRYLISAYKQGVKSHSRRSNLGIFEFYLRAGFFARADYLGIFQKWRQAIDNLTLDLHVYEVAAKHPKGLTAQFQENLGVNINFFSKLISRVQTSANISPSAQSTLALAVINGLNEANEATHKKIILCLSKIDQKSDTPKRSLLSVGERREMEKYYNRANRELLSILGKGHEMSGWRWNEEKEIAAPKATEDEVRAVLEQIANEFPQLQFP